MKPLLVRHFTAVSCIGRGVAQTLESLARRYSGLAPCRFETAELATHVGEVPGIDAAVLPAHLRDYDCRNNRLAELALAQDGFLDAVGAAAGVVGRRRVGVFLGTSTAGIHETEIAYRHLDPSSGALPPGFKYAGAHNTFSVADYLRRRLELRGPSTVVSCACASSAKVFAAARRMMAAGVIDAALVGGVDSLCLTTLYGFHSLQLCSAGPCRPFDMARDGISVGEAAAFAWLERCPDSLDRGDVLLLGSGETSDAHHLSAPHPEGLGARAAMRSALDDAGLAPADIDYINLHGTGTPSNDRAESLAVNAVFGTATPCSSTKGATGHALGAAGALEAVISALALRHGFMPGGVPGTRPDPALPVRYLSDNLDSAPTRVLSNSFGFGGTNCSLILGRAA